MKLNLSEEKIVSTLEPLIKKARGKVSPADLVAETGFPWEDIKSGLSRLIELYESRVTMNNETGALQFIFTYPLRKRGKKKLKEIAFEILNYLWKIFQLIYKAAIGIILIFYTIIFVIILIGLMFGGSSRDRDRNPFGNIISGAFKAIFEGMRFYAWTQAFQYVQDPAGFRYKKAIPEKNKGKNFIQSIYHFVFGPEHPDYNPLNDTKEAIAFIQKNNGRLTAGQIVALTGVTYEEAESRLAQYAAKFNGSLEINQDGIVVAEFYQLLDRLSQELKGGKIEFYIDEVDPPYVLTGNSSGRNLFIGAMNTFNFLMSYFIILIFTEGGASNADLFTEIVNVSPVILYGLGYFPFIFSILFFVIPLIRIPIIARKNAKREMNILRKRLFSAFINRPDEEIDWNTIKQKAKIKPEEEEKALQMMNKLVIELQGELKLNENGQAVYTFPRLAKELLI